MEQELEQEQGAIGNVVLVLTCPIAIPRKLKDCAYQLWCFVIDLLEVKVIQLED